MKKIILVFGLVFFWVLTGNCQWSYRTTVPGEIGKLLFLNYNTGLCANINGIYKTTNFGLNWIQTSSYQMANLYFFDSTIGWACGASGKVLKTTNGGNNWTVFNCGINSILSVYFLNQDTGFVTSGNGQGSNTIRMTTDGGNNWQIVCNTAGQETGRTVIFVDNTTGYVPAGLNLYKTTNGGYNWFVNNSFPSVVNDIYFQGLIGYAVGNNGSVFKTTNGGINWSIQQSGVNVNLMQASFININTGYVCGFSGYILKTTNGGNNWTGQTITTENLYTINFFNSLRGWCASSIGSIFVYVNSIVAPTLISPINNSVLGTLTPTLVWSEVSNALEYVYQVSPLQGFNLIIDSGTISTNQHQIPNGILQNYTTYFWRVKAKNGPDTSSWSSVWNFSILITNNNNNNEKIASYLLLQNYPNPFNSTTTIKYNLLKDEYVELKVYDILGRNKKTIISEKQTQGFHSINFDAGDLPSGIYYYKLSTKDFVDIKRMVLIK